MTQLWMQDCNEHFPLLHIKPATYKLKVVAGSVAQRIQDEINKHLDYCDITLVFIYSHIGEFTEEELRRSLKGGQKVFVFFKQGFSTNKLDDNIRYNKVLELRNEFEKLQNLQYLDYHNQYQLKGYLDNHVKEYINRTYNSPVTYRASNNTSATTHNPIYLNNVPSYELDDLVGREGVLQKVHETLHNNKSTLLLNGMGGVGKTTLAKAYVAQYGNNYRYIIWTPAQEGVEAGLQSDVLLLEKLNLTEVNDNILARVVDRLQGYESPDLWVIDNVVDESNNLLPNLPNQNWKVLLTSRQQMEGPTPIDIELLTECEALDLFQKHYAVPIDNSALVIEINEIVGHHTLTVELLGKLANKLPYKGKLDRLKEDLNNKGLKIADRVKLNAFDASTETNDTLVNIVQKLFDLQGLEEEEVKLLKYWSLLPNTDLLLLDLKEVIPLEEDALYALIDNLSTKGWLSAGSSTCRCHQIIQEAVLKQYSVETWENELDSFLEHFDEVIYIDDYKDNPVDKFKWAIYGQSIIDKLKGYESKGMVEVFDSLGKIYWKMGRFSRAAYIKNKAISQANVLYKKNDAIHAHLANGLALVLKALGDYAGAKTLLETALTSTIEHFGESHPLVAIRQSNLALVLKALGDYINAKTLLETGLASLSSHYGEDHPEVAVSQSNLGNVLRRLGDFSGAKTLLERALANDIKHYGQEHPIVAIRQKNLAKALKSLGDYAGAKALIEEALENIIEHYGEEHPEVATCYKNLALVFEEMNKREEALIYFEKAYDLRFKLLGKDHPKTKQALDEMEGMKK